MTRLISLVLFLAAAGAAYAQSAAPAVDLSDPVALLEATRAANGLSGDDLKP